LANNVNPNGFSPAKSIIGANFNGATNAYYIPSSDGSAYYVGDIVKTVAGGDANGVPQIQKAVGTDTVRGVIVSVLAAPPLPYTTFQGPALSLENIFAPATKTKAYYVLVADDPNQIFQIQDDGLNPGTTIATACNKNCSFTIAAPAGNGQLSGTVINSASIATTNTLNGKIMGLVLAPNNAYGAYARWYVKFNLHELNGAGTTAY
jgi:hypothetical protein